MRIYMEQKSIANIATDVHIIGLFKGEERESTLLELDQYFEGGLQDLLDTEEGGAKRNHIQVIHTFKKIAAKRVILLGLGEQRELTKDSLMEVVAKGCKEAIKLRAAKLSFSLESFLCPALSKKEIAHIIAEAAILANYRFAPYKTDNQREHTLSEVGIHLLKNDEEILLGIESGQAYGEGTCLARNLVNMPGNMLTPTILAEQAIEMAERYQMEYEILEREDMRRLGMGALLAVAQGGIQPPKMIVLKYQGKEKWDDVLAFVGKGLTFDTGGISLKPAAKMDEMKMDMGGAAAVLGAMETIGRLQPACNIVAVIPSTENMPSGTALKPGDVITSMSGKTIEVKNTDAEGRLILADGVTYAKSLGAKYIIDVATLTGAVLVALGDCTTAAITNNEEFMEEVLEAAQASGELMWRLPSYEPYKKLVKSSLIADLNNAPGRLAGTITAGLFIGEFAEDTPWVHLDIAGTAWSNKTNSFTARGGTGVMVRTLSTLAERFDQHVN